jgi:hypothetical protein
LSRLDLVVLKGSIPTVGFVRTAFSPGAGGL